jgi:hypothetical protein
MTSYGKLFHVAVAILSDVLSQALIHVVAFLSFSTAALTLRSDAG